MKTRLLIFIIFLAVVGCGNGDITGNVEIGIPIPDEEMIFSEVIIPMEVPDDPCDRPRELEIVDLGEVIDWGSKECRYFYIGGLKVFGDDRPVILGFRSDGVVVWKF